MMLFVSFLVHFTFNGFIKFIFFNGIAKFIFFCNYFFDLLQLKF